MARLLRAGWLLMMWLIAALAGGNFVYALNNDLVGLGLMGLLLAVVALAGSLLVLSSDFESYFRFEERRSAPPPRATRPVPLPAGLVVHEAAMPAGDKQVCARCGIVLVDFADPASFGKAWPAGTWIAATNGSMRPLETGEVVGATHQPCSNIGAW